MYIKSHEDLRPSHKTREKTRNEPSNRQNGLNYNTQMKSYFSFNEKSTLQKLHPAITSSPLNIPSETPHKEAKRLWSTD